MRRLITGVMVLIIVAALAGCADEQSPPKPETFRSGSFIIVSPGEVVEIDFSRMPFQRTGNWSNNTGFPKAIEVDLRFTGWNIEAPYGIAEMNVLDADSNDPIVSGVFPAPEVEYQNSATGLYWGGCFFVKTADETLVLLCSADQYIGGLDRTLYFWSYHPTRSNYLWLSEDLPTFDSP